MGALDFNRGPLAIVIIGLVSMILAGLSYFTGALSSSLATAVGIVFSLFAVIMLVWGLSMLGGKGKK